MESQGGTLDTVSAALITLVSRGLLTYWKLSSP